MVKKGQNKKAKVKLPKRRPVQADDRQEEENDSNNENEELDDDEYDSDPQPSTSTNPPKRSHGRPLGPANKRRRVSRSIKSKPANTPSKGSEARAKTFHLMKQETLGSLFAKLTMRALVHRENDFFQINEESEE